jgi:hypothetical protein
MVQPERFEEYLGQLTQQARGNLLNELERLELCGAEIPGAGGVLERLRAEFRSNGQTHKRIGNPARYFFAPLEPLLVDGAPEHANSGRLQRGSLSVIWEWINRDLLPTMARDYSAQMSELITADKQREARQAAATFQTKIVKSLENTLASSDGSAKIRAGLAIYTASATVFDDLTRMVSVLRGREALAKFEDELPAGFPKLDEIHVAKLTKLLDSFGGDHAEQIPFALALVSRRLKSPWHLILLATMASSSKNAADIAATPFAITVSMVLDRLDDQRFALRGALKHDRVLVAREILNDIYDTEDALRARIDLLGESGWGQRLDELMGAIAALVEAEVRRFPDKVRHVLGSRGLRNEPSLSERMTCWAWKGRDVVSDGAAYCKKLVSAARA